MRPLLVATSSWLPSRLKSGLQPYAVAPLSHKSVLVPTNRDCTPNFWEPFLIVKTLYILAKNPPKVKGKARCYTVVASLPADGQGASMPWPGQRSNLIKKRLPRPDSVSGLAMTTIKNPTPTPHKSENGPNLDPDNLCLFHLKTLHKSMVQLLIAKTRGAKFRKRAYKTIV